jgi:hypothetical protein
MHFQVNWAFPVLILALSAIFILVFKKVASGKALARFGFSMQRKDIEVDEDLPEFYKCVKLS